MMTFKKSNSLLAGMLALLMSPLLQASTLLPEKPVVVIDEAAGGGSIIIKNSDSMPMMLFSKVTDLDDDPLPRVVTAQPVVRLEPGQSQRIGFLLDNKAALDREHIKRISFEGFSVSQNDQNAATPLARQELPMLIVPTKLDKNIVQEQHLIWSAKHRKLTVTNTSLQVIRLIPEIMLLPDNMPATLPKTYILPGETLYIGGVCPDHLSRQHYVNVTVVSRDGVAATPQQLLLSH